MSRKSLPKEEYANYIDQIDAMILKGYYKYQIAQQLNISDRDVNKIINGLNDETSTYYNRERYQRLLEKIKENYIKAHVKNKSFGHPNLSANKLATIKLLLNDECDLNMAAMIRKKSIPFLLLELSTVLFEDYYEGIQQFLKPYGFAKEDNQIPIKKRFNEYPQNTKQEFLLLALTYRVSFKSMAKLLNTTVIDITSGFISCTDIHENTLDGLFIETLNESSEEQEQSYQKAKQYLHKRNAYIQKLNQYVKEKNEEKVSVFKEKIQELHHEIDDYNLQETLKKDFHMYTEEDKNIIVRSILKYYISSVESENVFIK